MCFGAHHLRHIVERFEAFYNQHRPPQGRDNRTLPEAAGEEPETIPFARGQVKCREELGGLLKHYYRKAGLSSGKTSLAHRGSGPRRVAAIGYPGHFPPPSSPFRYKSRRLKSIGSPIFLLVRSIARISYRTRSVA